MDYLVNTQEINGIEMIIGLTLSTMIAICSVALKKPSISSMAILGDISIGGTLIKVDQLANALQVCLDSGAKVLLPLTSAVDLGTSIDISINIETNVSNSVDINVNIKILYNI